MAGTDFSHLTNDELIKGIKALDLPEYIRSKAYGIDVRETLAQMTEMTIQLGVNMGLSPEDAASWARKLQESVSQSEFDSWVATLLDGGPSIFMNTLSELQSTYPNGAAGVALVRETDPAKIYVWKGSAWEDFGEYQGVEVKDGSITSSKLSDGAVTYDKQNLYKVRNSDNLFTGEFTDLWPEHPSGTLRLEENAFAGVIPIKSGKRYKIKTLDKSNRFTISMHYTIGVGSFGENIYRRGNVDTMTTQELYVTNEKDYNFLLVGVSNGEAPPRLVVEEVATEETFFVDEKKEVSSYFINEWISTINFLWINNVADRIIVHPIYKNAKIKVETFGEHERFVIFGTQQPNRAQNIGSPQPVPIYIKKSITEGNESFEFYNSDHNYIVIGLREDSSTQYVTQPKVYLTQTIEENVMEDKLHNEVAIPAFNSLTNVLENGNFKNGLEGWTVEPGVEVDIKNGYASFIPSGKSEGVFQTFGRVVGRKYYFSATFKTTSTRAGLRINFGMAEDTYHTGSGKFETHSLAYSSPSTNRVRIGIVDEGESPNSRIDIKQITVIDLTSVFGVGNEPDAALMDRIIENYYNGFVDSSGGHYIAPSKILLDNTKDISRLKKHGVINNSNSVSQGSTGIEQSQEIYPVMFGVKMTNERTDDVPRPIGWLYYHPETTDLYYANGKPDNLKFLCKWNREITWDGTSGPSRYRPFITKEGDIIFVWRGDLLGMGTGIPNVRQNPIVYPAGNWDNPVEVEINGTKPTAWLQNCGADFLYSRGEFIFAEYTRPSHENAHVWKVTKPFTRPENWRIVKSEELSGSNQVGMKHFHTVNHDPFSQTVFLASGDDSSAAKIYRSDDFGETFNVVREGNEKYCRVLNFVFTKDKVYWATDTGKPGLHFFFSIERDSNGIPDFDNITEHYQFPDKSGQQATYVTALIEGKGILFLDRYDNATREPMEIYFWDFKTSTMNIIGMVGPMDGVASSFGFRVEAINWYQPRGSDEIILGFGNPPNTTDLLGNNGNDNPNRVNNYSLTVEEDKDGHKAVFKAIPFM